MRRCPARCLKLRTSGTLRSGVGSSELYKFVDEVLLILRRRDLFFEDYEHHTFHGRLGFEGPKHRTAAAENNSGKASYLDSCLIEEMDWAVITWVC
jgi:hypothetical protein